MSTAMQVSWPKPLHYEARAYCEEHELPQEDFERVRQSMAYRELLTVMQPWMDMLVKLHPSTYSLNLQEPLPQSYLDLQKQVEEMRAMEMERLGLHASI